MLYISYAYERTTLSCCASEKLCQDLNADYAGRLFPSAMDNLAGSIMLYSGVYIVGIEEDVCINKNLIAHASHPVSDSKARHRVSILFPYDPTPASWHS